MDRLIELFRSSDELIPILAISGGLLLAFSYVVISAISSTMTNANRERTRREIAAYIAEGSMTPEQGERILTAKDPNLTKCG